MSQFRFVHSAMASTASSESFWRLAHAKDGVLLVDEIENGIHYSVQPDLWRVVFEMATRLNVQVFATTHSYDCIKAFEEAARESEEEGVLVRLARKGDRTIGWRVR